MTRWLARIGLGKYADAFAANDIGTDVLSRLTEAHLKELGVSIGDRLRLMQAIELLSTTPPAIAQDPPEPTAAATLPGGDAERRQLTVMFCDLVGSTALSTRLDPEDLRDLIRAYQDACTKVITRYNGYVAKYMGDGVLAYFGYPQAHGDDAARAARTGLGIVAAIAEMSATDAAVGDVELAVRVGIDTGQVVVGDIVGEGASEEASVVGETPNVAARLQALARPNQVVVGPLTRELIDRSFTCGDLGEHRFKGIAEPVHAWRVLDERIVDVEEMTGPVGMGPPLIGRQEELGLLLRSWEASKESHGQVVLVRGEAGIGKSRLLQALRDQVSGQDYLWVAIRCSPYHTNSTLYPVIEHMKRVMGWTLADGNEERRLKLEAALERQSLPAAEAVPLFAELLSLPLPAQRYPPLELSARQKREQTLDALSGWLFDEAEHRPVLQVWEDLHWADPTTLELLTIYIEQSPTVPMLNVLTYRPEFSPPWSTRSHMTPITLNRLERPEVEAIIGHIAAGKAVPAEVSEHIVSKADGVPLYVEELTKTILQSAYLREEPDRYTLSGSLSEVAIPATLQDSLMERLDRLPRLRELAQLGAVLGREFAYEMLQALAEIEEPSLRDGLNQLVDAELLYQRGRVPRARYIFKHALIQDAAYESLLKRTRQQYHRQVARLLENRFPETVAANPELVAHHYAEAGDAKRAVDYWHRAGERARAQSANLEAIAYLTKGIAKAKELPDSGERTRQEIALQLSLGHATVVAKGHGSAAAEAAYARALALCGPLGDIPELAPALFSLWRIYIVSRPLGEVHDVAMRLRRLAEERRDIELLVIAHYASGYTKLSTGDSVEARADLQEGIARYKPAQRSAEIYRAAQDPGVACRGYLAVAEWLLGYPDRAQDLIRQSRELAEELRDPVSQAYVLCFTGAMVDDLCGADADAPIERGQQIATEGGFEMWVAIANLHRSALRFERQRSAPALDELRDAIDTVLRIGVHVNTAYFKGFLAEAYRQAERIDDGLRTLDEAQASIDARGEHWWEAEIRRLRGELLLARPDPDAEAAQACFDQALEISRQQTAKSLELRAAASLARLWRDTGKIDQARDLLAETYGWFREGFATRDLKEAKALLGELG